MLPVVECLMFHSESRFSLFPGNPKNGRYIYGIQSWFTSVQFTKPIFLRFFLVLPFHECLGLQIYVPVSFFNQILHFHVIHLHIMLPVFVLHILPTQIFIKSSINFCLHCRLEHPWVAVDLSTKMRKVLNGRYFSAESFGLGLVELNNKWGNSLNQGTFHWDSSV